MEAGEWLFSVADGGRGALLVMSKSKYREGRNASTRPSWGASELTIENGEEKRKVNLQEIREIGKRWNQEKQGTPKSTQICFCFSCGQCRGRPTHPADGDSETPRKSKILSKRFFFHRLSLYF